MHTYRLLLEVQREVDKSMQEIAYLWETMERFLSPLTRKELSHLYDGEVTNWKKLKLTEEALMHIHYCICTQTTQACVLTQVLSLSPVYGL